MDFIAWMHETNALAGPALEAALAAAASDDIPLCASAAREAALSYLRRYLEIVGDAEGATGDSVAGLLEAAAGHDRYFRRLRSEAALLDAGPESAGAADDVIEAVKEIRFMAMGRGGAALGFSVESLADGECDPSLKALVSHATTVERAAGIFSAHAVYSFNRCRVLGLLSGEPIGTRHLLDPRRCADFVGFSSVSNYHAGEKVANSQRKGVVDEELTDDYQPSARLFFRRTEIEGLPGFDNDGMHQFLVRDQVGLDLLVCAVFPNERTRDVALARVQEPERRKWLATLCLVASAVCCAGPQNYVRVTNEMVARFMSEG